MAILSTLRLTLAVLASLVVARGASAHVANEYQVKAALLYNFAKFVEWPTDAFKSANDPIVLCVMGENTVGLAFEEIAQGRAVGMRAIQVNRISMDTDARKCHILFVGQSEHTRLADILRGLSASSVLTVGESQGFLERGGLIQLWLKDSRVRFEINVEGAVHAKCRISSKLLSISDEQQK